MPFPKHWRTCKCMVTKEISCNLGLGGGRSSSYLFSLHKNSKTLWFCRRQEKQGAEATLPSCGSKAIRKWNLRNSKGSRLGIPLHVCYMYRELQAARKAIKAEERCDTSWSHCTAQANENSSIASTLLHLVWLQAFTCLTRAGHRGLHLGNRRSPRESVYTFLRERQDNQAHIHDPIVFSSHLQRNPRLQSVIQY